MIRVCPNRDAICPHGAICPHSVDGYRCNYGKSDEAKTRDLAAEKAEYERMLSRQSKAAQDYTAGKLKSD